MIKHLYLKNFKCFAEQQFEFAALTVFCGSNSAGKSTAIQSLLSIKQNISALANGRFRLEGELFNFGKLKDLLSHNPVDNQIVIKIDDFNVKLIADELASKECRVEPENLSGITRLDEILSNDFIYLCAERLGPRSSFEFGSSDERLDIGIYGQFALSEYLKFRDQPTVNLAFAKKICAGLIESNSTKTIFVDALVREAMRMVCPGVSIDVEEVSEIDRVYNTYKSGQESIRPINVGFGVSYVLPIIISAALIKPGGILIIENPEVHLHPGAQANLVKILCELSKTGVQVIIETHSDHIINGIRVFAKDNAFGESENIIHSVTHRGDKRTVKQIHIDQDGNLTALDEGFFDQITKDLMRLF
ncbi:TPA: DUF3696 domain-containing protein [Enterobacter roggenkampii]|uniref:AAA family ATPase n=1 Tax=Enterobacter asburiae TaxID=61645 RepID=UPI002DBFD2C8|nr:DUF3696 domain-containing protein [Enterobacter asburiae]MEB8257227.1 DUF3696 domain-containing protein [Enterobacter asburiae]HCM9194242.1 DUF3696 domain-containing protein [Enterobacter cloacae subsp. dissolvens]